MNADVFVPLAGIALFTACVVLVILLVNQTSKRDTADHMAELCLGKGLADIERALGLYGPRMSKHVRQYLEKRAAEMVFMKIGIETWPRNDPKRPWRRLKHLMPSWTCGFQCGPLRRWSWMFRTPWFGVHVWELE